MKARRRGSPRHSLRAMQSLIAEGNITRDVSCDSKTAYSAGGADRARRAIMRKTRGVAIYHCRFCGNYHLTSVGG